MTQHDAAPLDEQVPATNCLEGIRCPACGSTAKFRIEALTTVDMLDDGTDETNGTEWNDQSWIECSSCLTSGTVGSFKAPAQMTCRQCGEDVFVSIEGTVHHWAKSDEPYASGGYVDHDADADHVAIPEIDEEAAQVQTPGQTGSGTETVEVHVTDLKGGETLVGEHGGTTVIIGEVYRSNVHPGMHAVEIEFGTLYLDDDLPVTILKES